MLGSVTETHGVLMLPSKHATLKRRLTLQGPTRRERMTSLVPTRLPSRFMHSHVSALPRMKCLGGNTLAMMVNTQPVSHVDIPNGRKHTATQSSKP